MLLSQVAQLFDIIESELQDHLPGDDSELFADPQLQDDMLWGGLEGGAPKL